MRNIVLNVTHTTLIMILMTKMTMNKLRRKAMSKYKKGTVVELKSRGIQVKINDVFDGGMYTGYAINLNNRIGFCFEDSEVKSVLKEAPKKRKK